MIMFPIATSIMNTLGVLSTAQKQVGASAVVLLATSTVTPLRGMQLWYAYGAVAIWSMVAHCIGECATQRGPG